MSLRNRLRRQSKPASRIASATAFVGRHPVLTVVGLTATAATAATVYIVGGPSVIYSVLPKRVQRGLEITATNARKANPLAKTPPATDLKPVRYDDAKLAEQARSHQPAQA